MGKLSGLVKWVRRSVKIVIIVIIALALGYWLGSAMREQSPSVGSAPLASKPAPPKKQYWTCSMHPQINLPKPGKCPICGMTLIPVAKKSSGKGKMSMKMNMRRLTVSNDAKSLMDIETTLVQRKFVTANIRMTGTITYDETRLDDITAWMPGRLDRLYVDYTGVPVIKGDHMVYIYSPELLSAQEEFLQSLKSVKNLKKGSITGDIVRSTLKASREKLRLLGLSAEQISDIEKSGKAFDHTTINAPISGIVIHKNAQEGMYVNTGTRIYTVADLSKLWMILDAYESDLMWIRYGQKVNFVTVAYPGETFSGRIAFIDPILDPVTRTVKVRVNVDNAQRKLKPGMFVKARVRAKVAADGMIMAPSLAGKWICPMHPSVIKDSPGKCDICGMPLVRTESLGYRSVDASTAKKPLVIPVSAALVTGTRAVVYVSVPGMKKPTYEGRVVVLGPRAGDYYIVKSGLAEGDLVVTNGNFKIDSALQIQAKPSMMYPEGGTKKMGGMHHGG